MTEDHEEVPDPGRLSFDERYEDDGESKKTRSDKWPREAGVYKSWKPPNFWAENSTKL